METRRQTKKDYTVMMIINQQTAKFDVREMTNGQIDALIQGLEKAYPNQVFVARENKDGTNCQSLKDLFEE